MSLIVVPDACALLDLVRAASRPRSHSSYVVRAAELIQEAEQQTPRVRFVIPQIVINEYARNEPAVEEETRRALLRDRENYLHMVKIFAWLRGDPPLAVADEQWIEEGITNSKQLVARLMAVATIDALQPNDALNATTRVFAAVPPSRRGKDSTADCTITEAALRIAGSGQATAPGQGQVFVSSNVSDYCEASGALRAPLHSEFAAVGIEFARNWGEARAHARRIGHV